MRINLGFRFWSREHLRVMLFHLCTKFCANIGCWEVAKLPYRFADKNTAAARNTFERPFCPPLDRSCPTFSERCRPSTCACEPNLFLSVSFLPDLFPTDWFFGHPPAKVIIGWKPVRLGVKDKFVLTTLWTHTDSAIFLFFSALCSTTQPWIWLACISNLSTKNLEFIAC